MPWNANILWLLCILSQSRVEFPLISYCYYIKRHHKAEDRVWTNNLKGWLFLLCKPRWEAWTRLAQLEWPCAQICGAVQRLHRPMALIRGRPWLWKRQRNEGRLFLSYLWHRSRLDAVLSQMWNLCSVMGPHWHLCQRQDPSWGMGAISISIIRVGLLRPLSTSTNCTAAFGV